MTVTLGDRPISIHQVLSVARGEGVEIHPEALQRCTATWEALMDIANRGHPKVYGLNTGVGINKDQEVTKDSYCRYNMNMLQVHCVGLPPYGNLEEARAVMVIKLNHLLMGYTGITPRFITLLKDMINLGVHPAIPLRGSVGEADIACLSHLGLVMTGQGLVIQDGRPVPSGPELERMGLEAVQPGPKDGLGLVTSNALGEALGALILDRIGRIVDTADLVYAMTLEAFHGNPSPLDPRAMDLYPSPGAQRSAQTVRSLLAGSYIWDDPKSLQDPLSLRCSAMVHGTVRDLIRRCIKVLTAHINAPDDNPLAFPDGTVVPSALFEPLPWVVHFEGLKVALGHLAQTVARRTLRLGSDRFTGLPRFLNNDPCNCHAFGVIQKTVSYLLAEVRHLCNPCSMDVESLSEDQEDRGCNTPMVMDQLGRIAQRLEALLAIEAIHAAQGMDLRGARYGVGSSAALERLRREVAFLDVDRDLSCDILSAQALIAGGGLLKASRDALGEVVAYRDL